MVKSGNRPVTLRATIENLFNKSYWTSAPDGLGMSLGAPRTVLVSASLGF